MRIEMEMIQIIDGKTGLRIEEKNKHIKQPNSHLISFSNFQLPKLHNYFRSTQKTCKKPEITKLQRNRKTG